MSVPVAARSKAWVCGRSIARVMVTNPTGVVDVCCECCVLSGRGRGLCNELFARPQESYRLWCVVMCDLETSWMRWLWPTGGVVPKTNEETKCVWTTSMTLQTEWLCVFVYTAHFLTFKSYSIYSSYSVYFLGMEAGNSSSLLIIKPIRRTNISNLFLE